MIELCDDIMNEILSHCDSKTTASLLSTNKYLYNRFKNHKTIVLRQRLAKNIKNAHGETKKYYNSTILKLKVNQLVTDNINNYRVVFVKNKIAFLEIIDLFGQSIDDELVCTNVCNIKQFDSKKTVDNLYWATYHYDVDRDLPLIIKLKYGLIKHKFGPYIKHVDSHYLMFKTCEQNPFDMFDYCYEPELNMLVTVNYKWQIYEYIIQLLKDDYMLLKRISDCQFIDDILHVHKIKEEWIIEKKKYKIIFFGGFCLN